MNHPAHTLLRLLSAALLLVPLLATAGGNAINGEELTKSKGCVGCHGADGYSTIPTNPILAGQYESYLVQALQQYQSGDRKNPIMGGFAAALSPQEIEDLAAWFASQRGPLQTAVGQ